MTVINLPGQFEVPLIVDHKRSFKPEEVQIAKLLRLYEERPTSETWSRIQALAKEILR